jgi:hypothetical protein
MEKFQFQVGHSYIGEFTSGGSTTCKVIKRTAKTVTIETRTWGTTRKTIQDGGKYEYFVSNSAFYAADDDLATEIGQSTADSHADDYLYL